MATKSSTFDMILRAKTVGKKDLNNFGKSIDKLRGRMRSMSKAVINLKTAFVGLGIGVVAKQLIDASNEQAKAVAGLETAIKSMGRETPGLSEKLQDLASSLQGVTNFGDEATIQGQKFLVTYQNISDAMLPRATRAMLDLAALMKGDVVGAANMLGKASMGMTGELRRVGITVDADVYKLRGFAGVLEQIEAQTKGQAEAMRKATGPWVAIGHAIGDIKEKLGDFLKAILDVTGEDFLAWLDNANKRLKKFIKSPEFKKWAKDIANIIKMFFEVLGAVIKFGLQYKEMLLIVAGTTAAVSIIGKLVVTIKALNAAMLFSVAGLQNLRAGLLAVAAGGGAASVALTGLVAAGAALGVINIGRLIYEMWQAKEAADRLAEANKRLGEQSEMLMARYAEFKDVKLPEDFLGKSPEQVRELARELQNAKAYWTAFANKMRAAEDMEGLKQAKARLAEIRAALNSIRQSDAFQQTQRAVMASSKALEDFEKTARKAYDAALHKVEEYGRKVQEWEEKIKYLRLSTADKIRELGRRTMSDAESWADRRQQAEEKLSAAKEALAQKDYELAEKLAKDAASLYEGLAERVEKQRRGETVVVKTIRETTEIAKAGLEEVTKVIEGVYRAQEEADKNILQKAGTTLAQLKKQLEEVAKARKMEISIEAKGLKEVQASIEKWLKEPATKIINIKTVEKKATGGRVGMAKGGRFAGNSLNDTIEVLARPGEGFVRNEALSVWDRLFGKGFFEGINAPWSAAGQKIKEAMMGALPEMRPELTGSLALAGAGAVNNHSESHTYLNMSEAASVSLSPKARSLVEELEEELKQRSTRGAVFG